MVSVKFWFEYASTYSYPAAMRVERVAAARGVQLLWRPFLLGPVFASQGLTDSPFNLFEQKGRYMWRDVERLCEEEGLAFSRNDIFPQNGLKAARMTLIALDEGWGPEFIKSVYRANFVDGLDISDAAVLENLVQACEQDPVRVVELAHAGPNKDRLRGNTEQAVALGVFGAPSFTVGEELFWGNDRMEAAFDWALR
jgi:2-hydroxychromene-2-carboxylate isomerase